MSRKARESRGNRKTPKKSGSAARGTSRGLSAAEFVETLHRQPCRWDILIHVLGGSFSDTIAILRTRLFRTELRVKPDQFAQMGDYFARGFEILIQQWLWGRDESLGTIP